MGCAGTAQARPSFELGSFSARAGDVVRFDVSGVDGWGVAYYLELNGEELLDGRSSSSGTFTMPYLGEDGRTVDLDGSLWWGDSRTRIHRSLEYRGPALPPPPQPPPPVPSPPAATAPAAPSPQTSAPAARPAPSRSAPPEPERRHGSGGAKEGKAKQPVAPKRKTQRRKARARDRNKRRAARKHRRPGRPAGPAGPFLEGFGGPAPSAEGDSPGPSAAKPAVLASRGLNDPGSPAVLVPAALALAGLGLAASVALRRRRLRRQSGP